MENNSSPYDGLIGKDFRKHNVEGESKDSPPHFCIRCSHYREVGNSYMGTKACCSAHTKHSFHPVSGLPFTRLGHDEDGEEFVAQCDMLPCWYVRQEEPDERYCRSYTEEIIEIPEEIGLRKVLSPTPQESPRRIRDINGVPLLDQMKKYRIGTEINPHTGLPMEESEIDPDEDNPEEDDSSDEDNPSDDPPERVPIT